MSSSTLICSQLSDFPDCEQPAARLRLVGTPGRAGSGPAGSTATPGSSSGGPADGGGRSLRFTAALLRESKWFVARTLEVDVVSQGSSIEEALANLREALELYFEVETAPQAVEAPIIASLDVTVRR
jgi:predicted RNase H-like HicB family nuclease